MKLVTTTHKRPIGIFIHIIIWMLIFLLPLLLTKEIGFSEIDWWKYISHIKMPLMFLITFYVNYLVLVPLCLLKKKTGHYFLYNLILLVVISLYIHLRSPFKEPPAEEEVEFVEQSEGAASEGEASGPQLPMRRRVNHPPFWTFVMRDTILLMCTVGVATAIRMSGEWSKAEAALQEAEKNRTEAELNNLRNQLNPHFLLNTLNNIYALIAFDSDKAQQAVQDLSKLLRYVLYENQQTFVPLSKEIDFIKNYIELMRIRVSKDVKVYININVPENSSMQIAPLIFISLIENAFKHGISPTEPSFISITITQIEQKEVRCEILNSNHPKNTSDKSGSGIGLEQVSRRLELLYPHMYEWQKGVSGNGEVYSSLLSIRV